MPGGTCLGSRTYGEYEVRNPIKAIAIIAGAVKMAVREALHEFKEEIAKEFDSKKINYIYDNTSDGFGVPTIEKKK